MYEIGNKRIVMNRKMVLAAVVSGVCLVTGALAQAQEETAETYRKRYELVVSKLGYDGVGVETILNQWAKLDSLDVDMLVAKFNYYFTKSQSTEVVVKPQKKYLGASPVLSLKDSTGTDIHYFQEVMYDDDLFADAMRNLDKAISVKPERIDLRFTKTAALMSYEKGSPDMALSYLLSMVDMDQEGCEWEYPGYEITDAFFAEAVQEYCHAFFRLGTPSAYNAFRTLSERMLLINPKDPVFLTNMGTYDFIVAKDYSKALKYYRKALKINPDDYTALKNSVLLARQQRNLKLERKFLSDFVRVAGEEEKTAAETRLKFLSEN